MSRLELDMRRYTGMTAFEREAALKGFQRAAGIDEAGRGPLAGPVAAAACILDPERPIYGLNDSKKLTPATRNRLYEQIVQYAVDWHVALVGPETIDEINILQATCEAMRQAVRGLRAVPGLLLVDAVHLSGMSCPVWPIVRGDALSVSIAAASILAKVTRDRVMDDLDKIYPEYGFIRHKGYGTAQHYEALLRYGPCPVHRKTFLRNINDQLAARGHAKALESGGLEKGQHG